VKRYRLILIAGCLLSAVNLAQAQQAQPANPAAAATADAGVRKRIEGYMRNLYAWGPEVKLTVSPLKETSVAGLLETTANLVFGEQKDAAKIYVSRDGKYMFRGELSDLTADPLADVRAKLKIENAPATGNPQATVTLVEFADFECPVCKKLHDVLREVLPKYPQTRLVFKDFPLSQIHPWAKTASVAARCAYEQNPKAFWVLYDRIYSEQELISAENAWEKVLDYANQAGLNAGAFKACMTSPEAGKLVDASFENGRDLDVNSTPTLFVNGRRMLGADPAQLEQYIRYELEHRLKPATKSP
jgi:protein-disulfide isomerase